MRANTALAKTPEPFLASPFPRDEVVAKQLSDMFASNVLRPGFPSGSVAPQVRRYGYVSGLAPVPVQIELSIEMLFVVLVPRLVHDRGVSCLEIRRSPKVQLFANHLWILDF